MSRKLRKLEINPIISENEPFDIQMEYDLQGFGDKSVIRKMMREDIPACADILQSVYNNEMWQCRWKQDRAEEYLTDFFKMKKFVGFVLEQDNEIIGAVFAHEKVWWNNSEVFVEEMFIKPQFQRSG